MRLPTLIFLLAAATCCMGQDATARSIYDKAIAARPATDKLRFYDLDWAPSLAHAKLRAHDEKRPIVLFWVTNISAGCDFFTGHT